MHDIHSGESAMDNQRRTGRTIAVLLLLQMAGGPVVNFVLLRQPLAMPGFLENAAAHSFEIGVAVLIALAMSAFSVGIAITAWPVLRRHSPAMALWLLAIAIAGLSAAVVENVNVLSMLSLSQAYANAGATDAHGFEMLAAAAASSRKWAHYLALMTAGGFAFVLFGTLFRFALVPRVLAGFGIVAALLEIIAVAMPLFGYRIVFALLAPLGLAYLALMLWLIVKGLSERQPSAPASDA